MQPARAIVTRPHHDAEKWVLRLRQAGIDAEALPLIEIAPLAQSPDPARQPAGYAACLFVSGHAVEHFFKENRAFAQDPQAQSAIESIANRDLAMVTAMPPGLRFLAPGPGTVAALRAAGVAEAQIDAPPPDAVQFDSEALWRVIGQRDWQGRRVLIVRGQSSGVTGGAPGRDWIARQWLQAGASVDFAAVYQRRAPLLDRTQLRRARAAAIDGSVWLFSSSEAIANLTGQAGLRGTDWSHARALATHPRIADAARAAGWGVVAESRPSLGDIADALRSIESAYP